MGDANEALFGGGSGAPGFKFSTAGDTLAGYITHLDSIQDRDFKTKELKFWPSGDKLLIALVTVQTELRDPTIPEDDGQRTAWVRGRNATDAVKDAVKGAGKRKLEEGGYFALRMTGTGVQEKGLNPPKLFQAMYRPPSPEGLAVYEAAQRRQTGNSQNAAVSDPWAGVDPDPGFTPPLAAQPQAAPVAPANDPWASTPAAAPQAVQQAPAASNGVPASVTLPTGETINTAGMTEEAINLLQRMGQSA